MIQLAMPLRSDSESVRVAGPFGPVQEMRQAVGQR